MKKKTDMLQNASKNYTPANFTFAAPKSAQPPQLKAWFMIMDKILFLLDDGTLQVNFRCVSNCLKKGLLTTLNHFYVLQDHTKIAISADVRSVAYYDEQRKWHHCSVHSLTLRDCPPTIKRRLAYAKRLAAEIVAVLSKAESAFTHGFNLTLDKALLDNVHNLLQQTGSEKPTL